MLVEDKVEVKNNQDPLRTDLHHVEAKKAHFKGRESIRLSTDLLHGAAKSVLVEVKVGVGNHWVPRY